MHAHVDKLDGQKLGDEYCHNHVISIATSLSLQMIFPLYFIGRDQGREFPIPRRVFLSLSWMVFTPTHPLIIFSLSLKSQFLFKTVIFERIWDTLSLFATVCNTQFFKLRCDPNIYYVCDNATQSSLLGNRRKWFHVLNVCFTICFKLNF